MIFLILKVSQETLIVLLNWLDLPWIHTVLKLQHIWVVVNVRCSFGQFGSTNIYTNISVYKYKYVMNSTKQRTSRTDLFWGIDNWSCHNGEKLLIFWLWDFFFFAYLDMNFYHLHEISDWLLNIFPQKNYVFFAACQIQNYRNGKLITLPEKPSKVLYTNGHISKSRSMNLTLPSN